MIHLITSRREHQNLVNDNIRVDFTVNSLKNWWESKNHTAIQLDTETNIVKGMYGWKGFLKGKNKDFQVTLDEEGKRIPEKRQCYVVQIGDFDGSEQFIIDIIDLDPVIIDYMKSILSNPVHKLIHNGLFDYSVIKWCFGVDIDNVIDTMLASQVIHSGLEVGEDLPKGYHSLAGCASRLLGVDISKAEQTGFNGGILTQEQVEYAATDVVLLAPIYKALKPDLVEWKLQTTFLLECKVLRSYGDAMCENLYLNESLWRKNMDEQETKLITLKQEFSELLIEFLEKDLPLLKEQLEEVKKISLEEHGEDLYQVRLNLESDANLIFSAYQQTDAYNFKWSSPTLKSSIIKYLYSDFEGKTLKDYKDYYNKKSLDENYRGNLNPLLFLLSRNFSELEDYLITNHLNFLLENAIFIPAGTVLLNLNSPVQKLAIFKRIKPNIKSVDKTVINKINHPLAKKLIEYNKAAKLATSYGQNFLDGVSPDGMNRIEGFTQILSTGRSSMIRMQLLP